MFTIHWEEVVYFLGTIIAKIGSILKTYGVAKVGDLPASKYEAFLTDLSAI